MRLVRLVAFGLLGCGGSPGAQPHVIATPTPVAVPALAPRASQHRLLLLAGEHAIRAARWTDHHVVAHSDREVWFVDPTQPESPRVLDMPTPIEKLVTTPESAVAAVLLADARVLTYEHGVLLHETKLQDGERVDAVSPDGRWMLVSSSASSDERVLDTHTGAQLSSFEQDAAMSVFDPTGTFLLRSNSLVRIQDATVLKAWRAADPTTSFRQEWVRGRGVVFEDKGVRLIDPSTRVTKLVRYECKGTEAIDFVDAAHGTVLHLCGNRAMLVDPVTAAVTRVKLPTQPRVFLDGVRARADGTLLVRGREIGASDSMVDLELAIDVAKKSATVLDRVDLGEANVEQQLDPRSCARWIGQTLGHGDWCQAEADGAFWLTSFGGSFALAKDDREIVRIGAQNPMQPGRFHLRGGSALAGVEETYDDGGTHSTLRWTFGAPPSEGPRQDLAVTDRWCGPAIPLPSGNLLAGCVAAWKGKSKKRPTTAALVELSPTFEVVAERALPSRIDVVLVGAHPLTWDPTFSLPFLATEWPGLPSTCGDSCTALATYAAYRDFAIRFDPIGKVQIAGTLDAHALACVDREGVAHPYDVCRTDR